MGKFPRKITGVECQDCGHVFQETDAETKDCYALRDEREDFVEDHELDIVECVECPECGDLELKGQREQGEQWQCVDCDEIHDEKEAYGCCE